MDNRGISPVVGVLLMAIVTIVISVFFWVIASFLAGIGASALLGIQLTTVEQFAVGFLILLILSAIGKIGRA